jgi:hypothetical protein
VTAEIKTPTTAAPVESTTPNSANIKSQFCGVTFVILCLLSRDLLM